MIEKSKSVQFASKWWLDLALYKEAIKKSKFENKRNANYKVGDQLSTCVDLFIYEKCFS